MPVSSERLQKVKHALSLVAAGSFVDAALAKAGIDKTTYYKLRKQMTAGRQPNGGASASGKADRKFMMLLETNGSGAKAMGALAKHLGAKVIWRQ